MTMALARFMALAFFVMLIFDKSFAAPMAGYPCLPSLADGSVSEVLLKFISQGDREVEASRWRRTTLTAVQFEMVNLADMARELAETLREYPARVTQPSVIHSSDQQVIESLPVITFASVIDNPDVEESIIIKDIYVVTKILSLVLGKLRADEEIHADEFRSAYLERYDNLYRRIRAVECKGARLLNSLISSSEMRLVLAGERVSEEELERILHRERTHARFIRDYHILIHLNSLLTNSAQVIGQLLDTRTLRR